MGNYAEQYRPMVSLLRTGKFYGMAPKDICNACPDFRSMNATKFRAKIWELKELIEGESWFLFWNFLRLAFFYSVQEVQSMDYDDELGVRPMPSGPDPKALAWILISKRTVQLKPEVLKRFLTVVRTRKGSQYTSAYLYYWWMERPMWKAEVYCGSVDAKLFIRSGPGRDHDLCFIDNDAALDRAFEWSQCMTDLRYLHKTEIGNDKPDTFQQHPRMLSFRQFLRKLRTKSDQQLTIKCVIKLPFVVKSDIVVVRSQHRLLGWKDTTQRVLYVAL